MPRILRNYLISFAIIGLIALAVTMVNRYVDSQMAEAPPAATPPANGTAPGTGGVAPDPPPDGKY